MTSRKKWDFLAIVFVWIAASSVSASAQSADVRSHNQYGKLIETTAGPIQGALMPTTITYLGIPFAEPPVGDLRWRPPEPHRPWRSVLDATRFGHHCLQATAESRQRNASEDCLFLNVYVPRKHRLSHDPQILAPWPVMVWIHGGANARGASDDFDPTPIVETGHGTVVVTLNYRLGPFGFLAHPALDAEGHAAVNYGVMDQQLALKWVRANIAQFGGDAHNVTIFGESSGGLDVATHLASPLSAGLFDKAIIQSGAYQLDTPSLKDSEKLGVAFANRADCGNQTASCLRALSAAAVLARAGEVNTPGTAYNQSTVDGQILIESQRKAFEEGRINRAPVLQGNNGDEGPHLQTLTLDEYRSEIQSLAKAFGRDPTQALTIYSLQLFSSPVHAVRVAAGDALFECSAQASNLSLSKWVPTFAYEFSDSASGPNGASHGAEQKYLLKVKHDFEDFKIDQGDTRQQTEIALAHSLDGDPLLLSAASKRLSEAMRSSWTAFARSGNPVTALTPGWPLASNGVEILEPSLPGALPNSELHARHHCDFWNPTLDTK
jgi:para-nitrobenzyl esterase